MPESDPTARPEENADPSPAPLQTDPLEAFRVQFGQLKQSSSEPRERNVDRFDDVTLKVSIELGRVTLPIREILEWREGSIVETRKLSGQPMEILVNGKLFGRGEVVVVGDNLAIRITDLIKPELD